MTTMLAMLAALALAGQADMAAPAAAMVEGRPGARDVSPIQERIDHAPTGSVIEIRLGDTSVTSSSIGRCVSSAVAGRCSSVRQPAALCACAPRTSSSKASTSMGAAAATWAETRQVFMSPAIPWSSATAALWIRCSACTCAKRTTRRSSTFAFTASRDEMRAKRDPAFMYGTPKASR